MSDLFKDVVDYFKKEHGDYCVVDDQSKMVTMRMQGEHNTYEIMCAVNDELGIFRMAIIGIMKIPKPKLGHACMLVNMINTRVLSTFFIDDEGQLSSGFSFPVKNCKLSYDAIGDALLFSFVEADKYYPAFQKLVWADISPDEALKLVLDSNE